MPASKKNKIVLSKHLSRLKHSITCYWILYRIDKILFVHVSVVSWHYVLVYFGLQCTVSDSIGTINKNIQRQKYFFTFVWVYENWHSRVYARTFRYRWCLYSCDLRLLSIGHTKQRVQLKRRRGDKKELMLYILRLYWWKHEPSRRIHWERAQAPFDRILVWSLEQWRSTKNKFYKNGNSFGARSFFGE